MAFVFGLLTMVSGLVGVPLGSYLSQKLKKHYPRADPLLCAAGLLVSTPLLAAGMLVVQLNSTVAFILMFFGELALNLNWAIVADILLVRYLSHSTIIYVCVSYIIPVAFT